MTRIASLPMYTAAPAAVERLWHCLADALRRQGVADVPGTLHWPSAGGLPAHWLDGRLLLGQACGHPFAAQLAPRGVQAVGAFHHDVPGCDGIRYRSRLVCREDDPRDTLAAFRGAVVACNAADSQSGYHALRAALARLPHTEPRPFFRETVFSGAHASSIDLVRSGRADLAAIDTVSHAGFERHEPSRLQGVRVFGQTPSAPGLPLITSAGTPAAELAALREAVRQAVADPLLAATRADLFITGFEAVDSAAYDEVRHAPPPGWPSMGADL